MTTATDTTSARQPKWQDLAVESLESIYNPRAAGPNVEAGMAKRAAQSSDALQQLQGNCRITPDLRYGSGPKETLDLYKPQNEASKSAKLAVFIHGGYWRGGDKHDSALVVPPLLGTGAVVANVNYDLCPDITLDEMVEQIIRAVRFCHDHASEWGADPKQMILSGHSAGAHLAARVMNAKADSLGVPADLVNSVVAISGIYEPEVITHISVNLEAQIELATAQRNDCLVNPPQSRATYLVFAGGDEPAGWIEQSRLYAEVVSQAGNKCDYFTLPGTDHFTVLCDSFKPESSAFRRIRQLLES